MALMDFSHIFLFKKNFEQFKQVNFPVDKTLGLIFYFKQM